MVRALKAKLYEEHIKICGMFSLKKGLWRDMIVAFRSFKGYRRKEVMDLFSAEPEDKTRMNEGKLYRRTPKLEIKR